MHSYTIHKNGQNEGPFTTEQIRAGLAQGKFSPNDLAWRPGLAGWTPISQQLAADSGAPAAPGRPTAATAARHTTPRKKQSNWVIPAIFATLFSVLSCVAMPFGILAIFFGIVAGTKESNGNAAGAAKSRSLAKGFTLVSAGLTLLAILAMAAMAPTLIKQGKSLYAETLMQSQALEISRNADLIMNDELTVAAELGKIRAKHPLALGWETIVIDGDAIPYVSNEGEKIVLKKAGKFSLRSEMFNRELALTPAIKSQTGPENEIEFFVESGLPVSE